VGHGEKRSRREDAAIAALLAEPTLEAAAERAGISRTSLFRWLQDPAFCDRYHALRREALSQATARLQQASSKAVDTLVDVMEDTEAPAAARVSAAKTVLELGLRAIDGEEVVRRLQAVEAAMKGRLR